MSDYSLDDEIVSVRSNDLAINPLILNRWSPRSFLNKPVSEEDLLAVLEAARWAPSAYNGQPWRFLVARTDTDRARMQACLSEKNQRWANHAPVLLAVLSVPRFADGGRDNPWSAFDAGAAWSYLALEARRRGIATHGMGGFSVDKVRQSFGVPQDVGVHTVVAMGYQGPKENLPPDLQAREHPSARMDLNGIWCEGRYLF